MNTSQAVFSTRLTSLLGCRHPIICAGMGGPARSGLAAAVSAAGGFGLLGMVRESPATIEQEIAAVRAATDRPFGVNLIPTGTKPELFSAELDACLRARVPAICFFWDVFPSAIEQAKRGGALVLYQVGSLDDALAAERAGADAIIAQGVEAGGHVRGHKTLMALLPEIASRVRVPVVASGGIVHGSGLVAALAMGASGVHCGTVFVATHESYAHDYHKQRIVDAGPDAATVHTDIYAINWPVGSPVRVLANSVTDEVAGHPLGNDPYSLPRETIGEDEWGAIPKYSTISPLRSTTGDLEKMPLYAGQSASMIHQVASAQEVILRMLDEAAQAMDQLNAQRLDQPSRA